MNRCTPAVVSAYTGIGSQNAKPRKVLLRKFIYMSRIFKFIRAVGKERYVGNTLLDGKAKSFARFFGKLYPPYSRSVSAFLGSQIRSEVLGYSGLKYAGSVSVISVDIVFCRSVSKSEIITGLSSLSAQVNFVYVRPSNRVSFSSLITCTPWSYSASSACGLPFSSSSPLVA